MVAIACDCPPSPDRPKPIPTGEAASTSMADCEASPSPFRRIPQRVEYPFAAVSLPTMARFVVMDLPLAATRRLVQSMPSGQSRPESLP